MSLNFEFYDEHFAMHIDLSQRNIVVLASKSGSKESDAPSLFGSLNS